MVGGVVFVTWSWKTMELERTHTQIRKQPSHVSILFFVQFCGTSCPPWQEDDPDGEDEERSCAWLLGYLSDSWLC